MRLRERLRRDDGVTLTELLIVIAILTVIVTPLTAAIIAFIRSESTTTGRLAESHDAQITQAYFTQDVQSVGVRDWSQQPYTIKASSTETGVTVTGGVNGCHTAGGPDDSAAVLVRFAWDDPVVPSPPALVGGQVVKSVAYAVVGTELQRFTCQAGGTYTKIVVAHNVVKAGTGVACTPGCTGAPVKATLTLQLKANATSPTPYTVVLVGERRQIP